MRLYADDVSDPDKNVSIHASVKDATEIAQGLVSNVKFQSTHL